MAQPKQWGLTPPMSNALPTQLDIDKNNELVEEMKKANIYETQEATNKRIATLKLLHAVNREFIKTVGRQQGMHESQVEQLGGKIFSYGSYRLGVHSPGSDIDTLTVSPRNVKREDFFNTFPIILRKMAGADAITSMTPVPDAFVPVIKLVLNGIEIDLVFASIASRAMIPMNFDVTDNKILTGMDDSMLKSVNGPRVADETLSLVPEPKTFRTALRAIKYWAKRRAIYANIVGLPAGVAWATLVARVCQMYPKAIGGTLLQKFFGIMKAWNWPTPVQLKEIEKGEHKTWNPALYPGDRKNLMPIITPAYPSMCTTYNMTQSSKTVVVREIARGSQITDNIFNGKATWADLFEKHTFFTKDHKYYLCVIATCEDPDDAKAWGGLVESKIRHFTMTLENNAKLISLARPFTKGWKRVHRAENDDQLKEIRKGETKYKAEATKTVEPSDPATGTAAPDGVDLMAKDEDMKSIKSEGKDGTPVTTYTYYIGIDPTPLLEQTRNLDIHNEMRSFKDKCVEWAKYDPDKHFLEVVPIKAWQLPDDVFDAGEVKPQKVIKKRKLNGDSMASEEPVAKKQATAESNGSSRIVSTSNGSRNDSQPPVLTPQPV